MNEEDNKPTTLTVAQLIAALQEMPQDAPVQTEGCDCDGDAARVSLIEREGCVMIWRNRG